MTGAAGPAALDVTQQQSVRKQHLSSTRSLPDCQGQRQRQELVLPVTRSAAEASRVPSTGDQASLVSTKVIMFQNDFILLVNKLLVK